MLRLDQGQNIETGWQQPATTDTELNEKRKAHNDIVLMYWQTRGSTLLGISPCMGGSRAANTLAHSQPRRLQRLKFPSSVLMLIAWMNLNGEVVHPNLYECEFFAGVVA